jgi:hypothetical protein
MSSNDKAFALTQTWQTVHSRDMHHLGLFLLTETSSYKTRMLARNFVGHNIECDLSSIDQQLVQQLV